MTRKSMRTRGLPLLGSNQDSPDPESENQARPLGIWPANTGEMGAKRGRTHRDSPRDLNRTAAVRP